MKSVIETLNTFYIRLVNRMFGHRPVGIDSKGPYPVVDVVVIVRIVLERIDLIKQAAFEFVRNVEVGLMRVKRTKTIGGINRKAINILLGHYIHHSANSISTETYRNHTLIDLDTLGIINRQVIKAESRTRTFLWHTVDKDFNVAAAEAIQHNLVIRPHASCFSHSHTRQSRQRLTEIFGGVL